MGYRVSKRDMQIYVDRFFQKIYISTQYQIDLDSRRQRKLKDFGTF